MVCLKCGTKFNRDNSIIINNEHCCPYCKSWKIASEDVFDNDDDYNFEEEENEEI